MNIPDMERHAAHAARLLKAMANAKRLLILCRLAAGEESVGELAALVGLSQSALSQHLARLREDGLVQARRRSQCVLYSLANPKVRELIDTLAALSCAASEAGPDAQPLCDRGPQTQRTAAGDGGIP